MTQLAVGLALLLAAGPTQRRAVVSSDMPPVVLMVRSAQTPAGQKHERKLFDELGFALDGFAVVSQPAERPDFADLPLGEQLAQVLPEATQVGAIVVVWLSFPLPQQALLHVVAIGSGRALIRTIETNRSPVSEATLALMARELLGTAYLFEPPKDVPVAVSEVVEKVKQSFPKAEEVAPPPAAPALVANWSAWLQTEANYPVGGGEDAVPIWGLGLRVARLFPGDVEGGLAVVGHLGSVVRASTQGARFGSVGGALSAYRGFPLRALSVGPSASVALEYATFTGPPPALNTAIPTLKLGAEARSSGEAGPTVALSFQAAYAPVGAALQAATGETLFRTASFSLLLGLAVGWRGL